jgi:plastocyanin
VSITNTGFNPSALSSVLRGSLVTWTNNGTGQHTVTDSTSMGLFDSGPLDTGQTYTQMFVGAGVYSYSSTVDSGMTGSVKVPVAISPTTVTPGQSYTVTWAAQSPPSGYVYDVQYKVPNGASWVNWQVDVTTMSAGVATDAGTIQGKWLYRARIQRVSNGATSDWSATTGVTVTNQDVTPPTVTITSGPTNPTTSTSATFTYTADETATFSCAIDGGAYASCPGTGKTYSGLAKGKHSFAVKGTDTAGNVSTPVPWDWYISKVVTATISDAGFSPAQLAPAFGTTIRWTNTGTQPHTVTDTSGVALFDSGPIPPGGTFEFFFDGASTYSVTSTLDTAMNQTIMVAPRVSPTSGTVTTPFTVTWAALPPPPSLLFDVLVKRPGTAGYQVWLLGSTGTSAVFTPDRGTGTYSFVAYVRNLANLTEGFSPKVSITVS